MQALGSSNNTQRFVNLVHQVPRVHASSLTAELFFATYQNQGNPVVITGLLDPEADWNLDYLCEVLNTQEFPIRYYGRQRYKQDKREWTSIGSGIETQSVPFIQYAEMLRNGEAYKQDIYLAKRSIKSTLLPDTLRLEHVEQELGLRMPASDFNLWLGPGGHVTCLHYDPVDGTLMQLHGAKRVVLFPPNQLNNLYPFSVLTHLRHGLRLRASYSQVYPEQPDFESFPKLKQALKYRHEVILNRGDVLYIPAGWWHELTALSDEMVCSVNRFWHIYPVSRALRWSKLRIHLGSVMAAPHTVLSLLTAIGRGEGTQQLSKLLQKI